MPMWLAKILNVASFGWYPFAFIVFCRECDFMLYGLAWTKRGAHRKADDIAERHLEMHKHEHHPTDEVSDEE